MNLDYDDTLVFWNNDMRGLFVLVCVSPTSLLLTGIVSSYFRLPDANRICDVQFDAENARRRQTRRIYSNLT